ncbi:MAG: efflux RND transporter periplasmic adaptor subunit [Bacteroidota bacterium]
MTSRQWTIFGVSALLIAVIAYAIFSGDKEEGAEKKARPVQKGQADVRTVTVKKVEYADIETTFKEYGRVVNAQPVEVSAEVAGRLQQGAVQLRPAASFQKGQLLFSIDSREERLQLQANKSNFLQQVAGILPDIKLDYPDEYEKWNSFFNQIDVNEKLPALPEFATKKERTFVASQNLLQTYYEIQSTEARLEKFTYIAPYNGSITEAMRQPGSNVSPGTAVIEIMRTDQLEVEMPVKVEQVPNLKLGQSVKLTMPNGEGNWNARLSRISDYVDPQTQSVNVYMTVQPTPGLKLYEGQFMEADLPGGKIKNAIELPRKSLTSDQAVWVVKDGKLAQKSVSVEKVRPGSVLVTGIEPGTLVLTDPGVSAQAGEPVKTELTK